MFVSIGSEMDSIAAGHFPEFSESFANCRSSCDRSDTACVHDLEITHAMTNQMFDQLVFESDKSRHHKRLVFRIVSIGAVTTVIATAREHMSREGG